VTDRPPVPPIRVVVVDDHRVVRSGLATFLRAFRDMELVGQASNGREAVLLVEKERPDVVLMDLLMPEMDGAAATKAIKERFPETQVVALTSFKEDEMVKNVLQAGAIGYLLKDVGADELAGAIRCAKAGKPTLAPEATEVLLQAQRRPKAPGHDLSAREREVLTLMIEGLNNKEIADRLIISPTTAKFHVSAILGKLGVTNRTEAVALAVQQRLVG
jgi:NarL family two-component system response regulator LiaR